MKQPIRILVTTLTLHLLAGVQGADTISLPAAVPDRISARPELNITTLGFGSCARQERPQPIWDTINAARCDAFVLLGDNIYADTSDPAVFREKYALLAALPGFARLRRTTPLFATWDDHDYGINDGGADFPGAAVAQKEFCDFFQVPATSPRRATPGVYDCVTLGPVGKRVQLILLDTRAFRSPLKKDPANPAAPKQPQPNRYRLHDRPFTDSNFALMRVKWDGPNPFLRLEVCGLEGEVVLSRDIPFSEIR